MEHRVNYLFLGLFVIGILAASVVFILWKDKYMEARDFAYYKVLTKESVSGLNINAPVKYHGVSVGEVAKLYIDPQNSEDVVIIVKLQDGTPIKNDSYAIIQPQGITGLSYLEIFGGTKDSPILISEDDDNPDTYPVIYTKPSMIQKIGDSMTEIGTKVENILTTFQKFINDENAVKIQAVLDNLEAITDEVKRSSVYFEQIMQKTLALETNATNAFGSFQQASDKLYDVLDNNVVRTLNNFDSTANKIEDLTPSLQYTLDQFTQTLNSVKALVDELDQNPSDIFFKTTPVKLGPGE